MRCVGRTNSVSDYAAGGGAGMTWGHQQGSCSEGRGSEGEDMGAGQNQRLVAGPEPKLATYPVTRGI